MFASGIYLFLNFLFPLFRPFSRIISKKTRFKCDLQKCNHPLIECFVLDNSSSSLFSVQKHPSSTKSIFSRLVLLRLLDCSPASLAASCSHGFQGRVQFQTRSRLGEVDHRSKAGDRMVSEERISNHRFHLRLLQGLKCIETKLILE